MRYRRPGPEPRVTSNQHRQLIATTRVQSERTRVSRAVPPPDSSSRAPRTTTIRRPPSYANASHRIPAAPARRPAAPGRSPGLCRYAGILSRTYIPPGRTGCPTQDSSGTTGRPAATGDDCPTLTPEGVGEAAAHRTDAAARLGREHRLPGDYQEVCRVPIEPCVDFPGGQQR